MKKAHLIKRDGYWLCGTRGDAFWLTAWQDKTPQSAYAGWLAIQQMRGGRE